MSEIRQYTVDDLTLFSDAHSYLSNSTMSEEIEFLRGVVTEDTVFVDVGAHIGVLFCQIVHERNPLKAIAIEPTPSACDLLRQNVRANKLKNAEVENVAAYSAPGKLQMFQCDFGSPSNSLVDRWEGKAPQFKVQADTVDAILERYGVLGKPLVIKIDAELSEPDVWAGMEQARKSMVCATMEIFTDAYKRANVDGRVRTMFKQMEQDGYLFTDLRGRPMTPGDILEKSQIDIVVKKS